MERYIEELIEIYRKNTLKSDEELESLYLEMFIVMDL